MQIGNHQIRLTIGRSYLHAVIHKGKKGRTEEEEEEEKAEEEGGEYCLWNILSILLPFTLAWDGHFFLLYCSSVRASETWLVAEDYFISWRYSAEV